MNSRCRSAFTLFELILAIALSATLIALIGTAINLYLMRVEASRDRVEEAQLARSILSMIADDLRATAIYQPQDMSSVAQLMSQSASFDVDSIDEERDDTSDTSGPSSPGGTSGPTTISSSSSSLGASGGSGTSGGSNSSSSAQSNSAESEMPLGLSGTLEDVSVDVVRPPTGDELFATLTGYTNAPMAAPTNNAMAATSGTMWGATPSPSDLKTIRYFVRDGNRAELTGLASTSLAPEMQLNAGGLVRQEIPRSARIYAEETANNAVLQSGQKLIAPEVLRIEFRYYNGQEILDLWDMAEEGALPLAVEVHIWMTSAREASQRVSAFDPASLLRTAREYRQTVFLPMAKLSQTAGAMGGGGSSSGSSSSSTSSSSSSAGTSSSGSTSSGFGSSSGQQ